MKEKYFNDILYDSLLEAEEDFKTIEEVRDNGNIALKTDLLK
jgi:hypothetical protein